MNQIVKKFEGRKSEAKAKTISLVPDNLRSEDTVEIVLGLGEGPWQGLEDGPQSFFVGDTALQNQSGENNFSSFSFEFLPGASPAETITTKLGGQASSITVNTKFSTAVPITRTSRIRNINYLELRFLFQQLENVNPTTGQVSDGRCDFYVEVKPTSQPDTNWRAVMSSERLTTALSNVWNTTVLADAPLNATFVLVADPAGLGPNQLVHFKWSTIEHVNGGKGDGHEITVTHDVEAMISSISGTTVTLKWGLSAAVPKNAVASVIDTELVVNNLTDIRVGDSVIVGDGTNSYWTTVSRIRSDIAVVVVADAHPAYWLGAGTKLSKNLQLVGITNDSYAKEMRFAVASVDDTYDIRVTKYFPGENDPSHVAEVFWESFQEIVAKPFKSSGLAMAHVVAKATDQFSSIPDFSGIYKTKIINVPSNYNPTTRVYTGVWDGQWKKAYSNNNALVLNDFVMDSVSGMNAYFPIVMDKWDVYEAAQWCDGMVSNGKGGLQPRFTFNQWTNDPQSAKEFAAYIAGTFNAIFYDDGNGTAHVKVDKLDDAVAIFTKEDVVDGKFSYSFTDINTRINQYTVAFTNPDLNWQEDRRIVEDLEHQARYGLMPDDFIAIGCIDVQEALRRTRYKLKTGTTEFSTVTFKTVKTGQFVNLFEIILISDDKLGYGQSGKLTSINGSRSFSFRDPIFLELGIQYQVNFQVPNTNYPKLSDNPYKVVKLPIASSTGTGNVTTIKTSADLPTNLSPAVTFSLEQANAVGFGLPKPFRVMTVSEVDNSPEQVEIMALEVNRNKFVYMDTAVDPGVMVFSGFSASAPIPGPSTVTFSETFDRFSTSYVLAVTPTLNKRIYKLYNDNFQIWSRPTGGGTWVRQNASPTGQIVNHPPGAYEFAVLPQNIYGNYPDISQVSIFTYDVSNPSDPPADVMAIHINQHNEAIWDYGFPPLDMAGFELRYRTDNDTKWDGGIVLHPGSLVASSPYSLSNLPTTATTLMIKAVDYFGNYSVNRAFIKTNFSDLGINNALWEFDFAANNFPGTITNGEVEDGVLQATGDGSKMWTSANNRMYSETPDTTLMFRTSFFPMTYISEITIPFSGFLNAVTEFKGNNVVFEYRRTGVSPMYEGGLMYKGSFIYNQDVPWLPLTAKPNLPAGHYQFKVTTNASTDQGKVLALEIIVDVPDITEEFQDVEIGAGGTRLPITENYFAILSVLPALIGDGGDAFSIRVLDKNPTIGPLIGAYDVSGNPTTGVVDARIRGY